jgi:hypothetical protein
VCGRPSKAHDFAEFTWRHLNFFQHHCYITANVPRTDCAEHGVLRITVPWAREGSRFTLLFEQAALMLVREMPGRAGAGRKQAHLEVVSALVPASMAACPRQNRAADRGHLKPRMGRYRPFRPRWSCSSLLLR